MGLQQHSKLEKHKWHLGLNLESTLPSVLSEQMLTQSRILKEAECLAFLRKVTTTNQEAKREETYSKEKLAKQKGWPTGLDSMRKLM